MGLETLNYVRLLVHTPSMSTLRASLRTLMVEKSTRTQNRKVQIGSASFQSGCEQDIVDHFTSLLHYEV